MIETGCGASTIAMLVHRCLYGGKVFPISTRAEVHFSKDYFQKVLEIISKRT